MFKANAQVLSLVVLSSISMSMPLAFADDTATTAQVSTNPALPSGQMQYTGGVYVGNSNTSAAEVGIRAGTNPDDNYVKLGVGANSYLSAKAGGTSESTGPLYGSIRYDLFPSFQRLTVGVGAQLKNADQDSITAAVNVGLGQFLDNNGPYLGLRLSGVKTVSSKDRVFLAGEYGYSDKTTTGHIEELTAGVDHRLGEKKIVTLEMIARKVVRESGGDYLDNTVHTGFAESSNVGIGAKLAF